MADTSVPAKRSQPRPPSDERTWIREVPQILRGLAIALFAFAGGFLALTLLLIAFYFPRQVDDPLTPAELAEQEGYYSGVYDDQAEEADEEPEDSRYVEIAKRAAENAQIVPTVTEFVRRYHLENAKVLDVGAGRGYLQDVVDDYTGLDISPTSERFFHKPFVRASATAMPFEDNEFDLEWSVWVLEHVPNPEAALTEMRRTVKDGGFLYLEPAWNASPWAADGYEVRPYSDFGMQGKLWKALWPADMFARRVVSPAIRLIRYASWRMDEKPTQLRYNPIEPNYETYWVPDSDAVNDLDRYETELWFLSRGDECLNCEGALQGLGSVEPVLIIRVHKGG